MANAHENLQSPVQQSNGTAEHARLAALADTLQQECDRLRQALAAAETERDGYRQLFLGQARAAREFEDLDIPTLEAMSAGPLDPVEQVIGAFHSDVPDWAAEHDKYLGQNLVQEMRGDHGPVS